MPREFEPQVEHHFGRTYRHWESPVLQQHYVDFKPISRRHLHFTPVITLLLPIQ